MRRKLLIFLGLFLLSGWNASKLIKKDTNTGFRAAIESVKDNLMSNIPGKEQISKQETNLVQNSKPEQKPMEQKQIVMPIFDDKKNPNQDKDLIQIQNKDHGGNTQYQIEDDDGWVIEIRQKENDDENFKDEFDDRDDDDKKYLKKHKKQHKINKKQDYDRKKYSEKQDDDEDGDENEDRYLNFRKIGDQKRDRQFRDYYQLGKKPKKINLNNHQYEYRWVKKPHKIKQHAKNYIKYNDMDDNYWGMKRKQQNDDDDDDWVKKKQHYENPHYNPYHQIGKKYKKVNNIDDNYFGMKRKQHYDDEDDDDDNWVKKNQHYEKPHYNPYHQKRWKLLNDIKDKDRDYDDDWWRKNKQFPKHHQFKQFKKYNKQNQHGKIIRKDEDMDDDWDMRMKQNHDNWGKGIFHGKKIKYQGQLFKNKKFIGKSNDEDDDHDHYNPKYQNQMQKHGKHEKPKHQQNDIDDDREFILFKQRKYGHQDWKEESNNNNNNNDEDNYQNSKRPELVGDDINDELENDEFNNQDMLDNEVY